MILNMPIFIDPAGFHFLRPGSYTIKYISIRNAPPSCRDIRKFSDLTIGRANAHSALSMV